MNQTPPIVLTPYCDEWPSLFEEESHRLQQALGDFFQEIYHIGSTAIPGMIAKPIIDILLSVDDIETINLIEKKLIQLGYHSLRRQIIPHVSFFTKRHAGKTSFHLHLHERGSPQIKRHVHFKDYLTEHAESAQDYAALKEELVEQCSHDLPLYVSGKDNLIQKIDAKAKLWEARKRDFKLANPGSISKKWLREQLLEAIDANLNIHMTHFAQYLNSVELIRRPGLTLINSGLPDDTFNYVIDADFSSEDAGEEIARIRDYFSKDSIPFSWWVSPLNKPKNLAKQLEKNGFINTENNHAMYLDLGTWDRLIPPNPSLDIVQATDEKTLQDFALVLANDKKSFKTYFSWIASVLSEDDPVEYYVGYVQGKPVVRGLSCYFAQVVGLHWLSTVPEERKKGYGTAMQYHRLKRAKELGYRFAALQASPEGYSLYKQLGYQECGLYREFKIIEKNNN